MGDAVAFRKKPDADNRTTFRTLRNVTPERTFQSVDFLGTARIFLSGGGDAKALPAGRFDSGPSIYGPAGPERRLGDRDAKRYLSGYGGEDAIDWVYDAINLYAEPAGSAAYHIERNGKRMRFSTEDPKAGEYPGGVVPSGLEGLLARPNPNQTYAELLQITTIDLKAAGDAYWLKFRPDSEGRPLALYRLAPSLIEVVPGDDKLVDRFIYRVPGAAVPLEFSPKDIVHFKNPNPHSDVYGLSVLAAAPRVYDVELGLVETMRQFFARGAKLSGVLTSDRSIPEPLVQKIQRRFGLMYGGAQQAYQVAVLERGMEFQSIQPTAAEAQFEKLSNVGRDRIFQMFGVHPALVNGDFARPGLVEEAQRYFDTKKLRPFLDKIEGQISDEIAAAWGVQFKIDYEYVMPEKDRLAIVTDFSALPGVKIKEVREKAGLQPLGDDRDDIVINLPGITTEDNTGFADKQNPNGGRPPNPQNTAEVPGANQQLPNGASAKTKPDARAQRRIKAVLEGDAKAIDALFTPDDTLKILEEGKALKKNERGLMIDDLEEAGVDEAIVDHVAEGVRRGYSAEQMLEGVDAEGYVAVGTMI